MTTVSPNVNKAHKSINPNDSSTQNVCGIHHDRVRLEC